MITFILTFVTIFIFIHLYLLWFYKKSFNYKFSKKQWLIFIFLILLLIGLRLYSFDKNLELARLLNYEFGFILLLLPITLLLHLGCLLFLLFYKICNRAQNNNVTGSKYLTYRKVLQNFAVLSLTTTIILFIVGIYNYHQDIYVNKFQITSPKISKEINLIHITDTQYGTADKEDLSKVADAIHALARKKIIDFIIFTGDAVDTAKFTSKDLQDLSFANSSIGKKLFSLGNHEFYHDYPKPHKTMEKLGYQVLRSSNYREGEINIIGADDPTNIPKTDFANYLESQINGLIDKNKYNLLMYHRPVAVDKARELGIDLMLTGHTHGGQFFPYTWLVQFLYQYPFGLVLLDNFYLYNSNGASLWGPRLRLGTRNEISLFTIIPKNN